MDNDNDTNNNNDNTDNNNDDEANPIQPQRNLLLDVFNSLRTPLRNRNRIDRQESIDRQHHQQQDILNLEADIGLRTTLFDEEETKQEEEEEE